MYKEKKKTADLYKSSDFILRRNHFFLVCSFCSQVFLLQNLDRKQHKSQITLDRLIMQCRICVSKSKSRFFFFVLAQLVIKNDLLQCQLNLSPAEISFSVSVLKTGVFS